MPVLKVLQGSNHSSKKEAWERWVVVWHVVFYLTLALPTALALLSKDIKGSPQLVAGLSLAQGIWYGLIMVWFVARYRGRTLTVWTLVYLAGAIALWIPLARAHPAYYLTASSFYGLMWGILPFGLAVAGNLFLTGVIIWLQGLIASVPVPWSWEMVIYGVVILGWSILLAAWMRSVMRESSQRKSLIEQLEIAQHDLATAERQAGILQERQRMAQEIHDTLAQDFTSIILQLEAADQLLHNDLKAAQGYVQQSRDIARSGLAEARRLVQALRPEALEKASLPEALERASARWAQESGITLNYLVTGEPCSLHPGVEVTMLRAMQETLANVNRHAQAQEASVTISYMEDKVVLDVHDDGIGFDPQVLAHLPAGNQGGFGLHSMSQRAAQFGGKVVVESNPGKGTTVAVQIPYTGSAPTISDSYGGLDQ
jgi:signal transduction histidine kinase